MIKPTRIAYVLGVIGIVIALKIQYDLAVDYATTSGKTRAMFGIKHLFELLPWAGLGVATIVVALIGRLRKETWKSAAGPILLGLVQILLVLMELYKLTEVL